MGGLVVACALLQRGDWLGLRRYPTWPTLQRFWVQGDSPCTPGGGCAPCTPPWRDEEGAVVPPSPPSNAFGNRGTHHTPAEATPPAPCVGTAGDRDRGARGGLGEGDGTVAKRDPARSSAVIAPTAVRPRCDGLFPAGAALRRFSEQGGHAAPPAGAARPARCLGERWGEAVGAIRTRGGRAVVVLQ